MPHTWRCVKLVGVILALGGVISIFIEDFITLQPNKLSYDPLLNLERLQCTQIIKNFIHSRSDTFDPTIKALLLHFTEHGLKKSLQDEYFYKTNTQQLYFTDPKALQKKIEDLAPCQHTKRKDFNLAVCSLQGAAGQYVQEWVSHYILLGVSKFIIYNNNENGSIPHAGLDRAYKPFVEAGYVELIPWANKNQPEAVKDCMTRVTGNYEWISFLDADEYITFNNGFDCIPDFLESFLGAHNNTASIAMRWRILTTRGVAVHDTSTTLYEQEVFELLPHEKHKKQIANIRGLREYETIHQTHPKEGYKTYDANGVVVEEGPFFEDRTSPGEVMYKNVELRHFWGLSLEYLFYDKLCGPGEERKHLTDWRLEDQGAFKSYQKGTVVQKIPKARHQDLLHKFLFN